MQTAKLDKRELILAKGAAVITRRGYHGTGVQEIVQAAGIPKGSFYHYFASKEDFALAALEAIYRPRLARYQQALSNPALTPVARVLAYYRDLEQHFAQQTGAQYHCFIGSLSFEMSDVVPALGEQVDKILAESVALLAACLQQAQHAGELAADEDCSNLALFIANAWQGVLTRLKVSNDLAPVSAFVQRLERLLTP
ncbi:TetR/AcrR family transcriptional regulator [Atopomonas sediminilitoris]|uniref:TetR/AcrR family transcriptional regulator n=1 Tax=Atopomonas sediminilitoris TaxID=2919919 RepID=UPI001F4E3A42|nr:TetR/AcrR family transcriptional regulator [Atopomonas sediminilitoris]MCJ8170207.1 TetR/AcrR family transcriptional regulator [Atopomonas sediminilitoris]